MRSGQLKGNLRSRSEARQNHLYPVFWGGRDLVIHYKLAGWGISACVAQLGCLRRSEMTIMVIGNSNHLPFLPPSHTRLIITHTHISHSTSPLRFSFLLPLPAFISQDD